MIHITVKKMLKYYVALLYCLGTAVILCAHPHVYITSQVEFVWKDHKLDGAYQTWRFDRFFSADIIQGFDLDKDGSFNSAETQDVYENAFINTKKYHFFTFIRQHNRQGNPQKVYHFSVRQHDGIVSYCFYVDLSAYTARQLYFGVYDYTYFCDFRYKEKEGVRFSGFPKSASPTYKIIENKENPVYYNPYDMADSSLIYKHWKPGLEIYYPKEILLAY